MSQSTFKMTVNSQKVRVSHNAGKLIRIETLHGTDITDSIPARDKDKVERRLREEASVEAL